MKTTTTLLLLALSICAHAETAKLIAKLGGKDVGDVVYKTDVAGDHSWMESFVSTLTLNGHKFQNSTVVHFSSDGKALEDDEKESLDGEVRRDESIKFNDNTAVVTNNLTHEKTTYDAPDSPPTLDPSDGWFVLTKPKIGDKAVASSFSTEEGWHTTTVTYVEDKPFKLGDQTVQGHLLRHEHPKDSYEEIVDDHGLPLQVDLPSAEGAPALQFVRSPYTDL